MKMYNNLYKKCFLELKHASSKIISKYKRELNSETPLGYLQFYNPLYYMLKKYLKILKNKKILEIGYGRPYFLKFLKSKKTLVYGIDIIKPIKIKGIKLIKVDIEKIPQDLIKEYKNNFDVIIARLIFSKEYQRKYNKFQNKNLILKNLNLLLKKKGKLILQDDKGTIFTKSEFRKANFKILIKQTKVQMDDIVTKEKNKIKNTIMVLEKTK
ncbi:MAG: hypothetical protein IB618_01815 [Candidatus Pacearchaeota archaeon]|nr:MAG: hypothetical protein IB618_01815 [Candidatus Pacearchaeota archaeon]